ncbi:hypothetical protein XENTR_v10023441 [Xenopus tropicalis]|nr:hypothetical protein XENTR_v10023441 [Xenopus tropicalis]
MRDKYHVIKSVIITTNDSNRNDNNNIVIIRKSNVHNTNFGMACKTMRASTQKYATKYAYSIFQNIAK